jgi:hypothetical protein
MAFTVINTTDTLEQMRVKLNNLTTNDFGDPANLSGAGLAATSIVGAVVEIAGVAFSAAGWTIRDSSSTIQVVGAGQTLDVRGTSNQITAVVSAPDLLTLSLTSNVTIPGNFTAGGNITASGTTHTLGTVQISGNTIRSVDSSQLTVNDSVQFTGTVSTNNIRIVSGTDLSFGSANLVTTGFYYTSNLNGFVFEGSTSDDFETALRAENPTSDNAIVFPNISGTVITNGDTGTVTNTMLAGSITGGKLLDDAITEAKIADDAVGQDQLKSLVTLQILNSSGGVLKTIFGAGA